MKTVNPNPKYMSINHPKSIYILLINVKCDDFSDHENMLKISLLFFSQFIEIKFTHRHKKLHSTSDADQK